MSPYTAPSFPLSFPHCRWRPPELPQAPGLILSKDVLKPEYGLLPKFSGRAPELESISYGMSPLRFGEGYRSDPVYPREKENALSVLQLSLMITASVFWSRRRGGGKGSWPFGPGGLHKKEVTIITAGPLGISALTEWLSSHELRLKFLW